MKLNYQKHACQLLLIRLLPKLYFHFSSINSFENIQGAIIILVYMAYLQIIITHPGPIKFIPPIDLYRSELQNSCKKCNNNWKPPRAHHCNQCNICIFGFDHHCNWFGKCIGIQNIKFFLQFLFYTMIICICTLIQAFKQLLDLVQVHKSELLRFTLLQGQLQFSGKGILEIIEIITSIHILRITSVLFFHKFSHILDNSNYIYQSNRKLLYGYNRGKAKNFLRIFGYNPILYFIPLKNKIRVNLLELNYEKFPSKSKEDLDYQLDQGKYPQYQIN